MGVQSLGREYPPEEEMSTPLQYSGLENPMDRGAWWATVHGVGKESSMTEATNMHTNLGHVGIPVTLCRSRECLAGFLVLNNHISSCLT